MSDVILKADGNPFANELSAIRRLAEKGLAKTHEVQPYFKGCNGAPKGYCIAPRQYDAVNTVIATLHLARERKEQAWAAYIEAERAHELAVDAVNAELQGFYRLQEQSGKQPAESPELKDLPPGEWRAGDLVECIDEDSTGNEIEYFSNGKQYPVLVNDGTSSFKYLSNDGEGHYAYNSCFRFIRRP